MSDTITIRRLRNNISSSSFEVAYHSLLLGDVASLSDSQKKLLLKIAIVLLNTGDEHLRKLGYRIVLSYSNLFNDYQPLFDAALHLNCSRV